MTRRLASVLVFCMLIGGVAQAADLVRLVRYKISAGDLLSGMAAVEDYKREKGTDAEYLDAIGWLARGAEMLRKSDLARQYVAELHREIPAETPELLTPYGAAIEVEGRLIAASEGRGAAIRFFDEQLRRATATSLRSRIRKNINLLSLEGQPATNIGTKAAASLRGKPALLYFFAEGCGDCKAQSASVVRLWQKYRQRGLQMIAATRLYGGPSDKPMTPDEERAQIAKAWKEMYAGLEDVPVIVDDDTMIRWGVSATPTFALVDRKGIVRLYTPTRLSEAELSRRIDELLAEVQ